MLAAAHGCSTQKSAIVTLPSRGTAVPGVAQAEPIPVDRLFGRRISDVFPLRQTFARLRLVSDNPPTVDMPVSMNLFRLLSEFIVLLLGALLLLMAAMHKTALPSRPALLIILGIVFVFWAARAWTRPAPKEGQLLAGVRAGSLAVVGILLIAIPLLSLERVNLLLGTAGAVLVVRGILGGLLSLRHA
jgi:hypothetical protein